MYPRNEERKNEIYEFIGEFVKTWGVPPSMQEIADGVNCSKAAVYKFIMRLLDEGYLERVGSKVLPKDRAYAYDSIPVVGAVACGKPKIAIEDIQGYLPMNLDFLGEGKYFALIADGESMINAGIDNGDIVVIRQQSVAENGQIVVAMVESEYMSEANATLKRFFKDEERHCFRLHPENDYMSDIIVDDLKILGVAVKVIKDLI